MTINESSDSFSTKCLAPLGITAAASAVDAGTQKKKGSGTTTLIILNEEMNCIIKIVQALENSNILLKGVTKTIENETKKQKERFLSTLLDTLGASLLGNLLAGKGIVREQILKCKSIIKMNQDLMVLFQEIIYLKKLRMGYT